MSHRFNLLLAAVTVCILAGFLPGCGGDGAGPERVKRRYQEGDYEEAVLIGRKLVSRGKASGELHYYLGLALLALGRDFEAFADLELAASEDPGLARSAARELKEVALSEFDTGRREKARRKLLMAVRLDGSLDLGRLGYLAGEGFYAEKDYARAAVCYEEGLLASPDSVVAGDAMLRLGEIYSRLGRRKEAEEMYRRVLAGYPYGNRHSDAEWRLGSLLLEEAERELELGNFDASLERAGELLRLTGNPVLTQNARYVMGRAYEGLLRYDSALEQYLEIVRLDTGSSGNVVEKARRKIDSFRKAGLYR